jgi:trehalose 2-sulfotransferase
VRAPSASILICGVQRAGTWLLAHSLASSGVAGHPAEYFSHDDLRRFREQWDVTSDAAYLERVIEKGTTPNGVFATKLMWNSLESFLFRLRRLLREYDRPDLEVIEQVFPRPQFVWIRRRDLVAQGVSWAKAAQTGQFAAHQAAASAPVFDFAEIDALVHLAAVQTGNWRRWFAVNGMRPVEITYEELRADTPGVVADVLASLGLELPADVTIGPPPELRPQGDSLSEQWIARYRELAAASHVARTS